MTSIPCSSSPAATSTGWGFRLLAVPGSAPAAVLIAAFLSAPLGTLADRLRLSHRPSHRALDDALATTDLLHVLLERAAGLGVLGLDDLEAGAFEGLARQQDDAQRQATRDAGRIWTPTERIRRLRAAATRWRRIARRSSSVSPPQMPESWLVSRA